MFHEHLGHCVVIVLTCYVQGSVALEVLFVHILLLLYAGMHTLVLEEGVQEAVLAPPGHNMEDSLAPPVLDVQLWLSSEQ